MNSFQLDENFNDKRLAEQCNAEGRCELHRFPPNLRGQQDRILLPNLLGRKSPILTKDFRIVEQNKETIPAENAGLIVVKPKVPRPSFTSQAAASILGTFKQKFPPWSEIDWSSIYAEINEKEIYICALKSGDIDGGVTIGFDVSDFEKQLTRAINEAKCKKADNPAK